MTAVVTLPDNIKGKQQSGDKMGAFINNECRGTATLVNVSSTNAVFFVMIHGTSSEVGKIQFKYYSAATEYMYETFEFLDFKMDGNYGTADTPATLDLHVLD